MKELRFPAAWAQSALRLAKGCKFVGYKNGWKDKGVGFRA